MRTGGVELLAGVTVDPTFGPVLAVGLGGVWVEVLARHQPAACSRSTPARSSGCSANCAGCPAAARRPRHRPADLDVLAQAIAGIGDAALSLGGSLRALEVNPLWVDGDQVEALDVLVVTEPQAVEGTELST